jgi:beta-glucosidase
LACGALALATACSGSSPTNHASTDGGTDAGNNGVAFGDFGSLSAPSGKDSFRFGAATADTQIEDKNTNTDWYIWTEPTAQGGLGKGTDFVDDASMGYTKAIQDVQLLKAMHLDAYRFSISWARVEPERGVFDQAALQHYSDELDALVAAGIHPMITIHHFSNPIWVEDPRDPDCKNGPSDTNLCGWANPTGGPEIVQELANFAGMLAKRFGDRVDDWDTLNEPVNYLLACYVVAQFPPGKFDVGDILTEYVPAMRTYLDAHAAVYDAIKKNDTVDADGDGVAANVGISLATVDWLPSRDNKASTNAADVQAAKSMNYVFDYWVADALETGGFDTNLDGKPDEQHPDWKGKLDWLGVQYYERSGVTAKNGIFPVLNVTPCFTPLDFGSCLPPVDPTFCVPQMGYEFSGDGVYDVLQGFSQRYPKLPLVVSESGIATDVGKRRAEVVVRVLQQIARARADGMDVRGYYHWSLLDNFEWAMGFAPHFGLYHVDRATFARTPTEGATVLGQIAGARRVTEDQIQTYGGDGPLTPEPKSGDVGGFCKQVN